MPQHQFLSPFLLYGFRIILMSHCVALCWTFCSVWKGLEVLPDEVCHLLKKQIVLTEVPASSFPLSSSAIARNPSWLTPPQLTCWHSQEQGHTSRGHSWPILYPRFWPPGPALSLKFLRIDVIFFIVPLGFHRKAFIQYNIACLWPKVPFIRLWTAFNQEYDMWTKTEKLIKS